ncbi:protein phosphatase 2C domain-containing protein [Streptomyces sp. NBC_01351]|uniref:protein phosphatase 2C domain-containing protein n=1 Tax=Streptomyces sp. NBC_01351 TaxID=2903833 RepID=UPI002E33CC4E|nr:protein phosphatase 2C domain-containing protein [Streptomyces sp. NBC_01351]
MSQQGAGADDWWRQLYEDPDPEAVPETDPGDTLDNRFHSASSLTTPPNPTAPPPPAPTPPPPAPGHQAPTPAGHQPPTPAGHQAAPAHPTVQAPAEQGAAAPPAPVAQGAAVPAHPHAAPAPPDPAVPPYPAAQAPTAPDLTPPPYPTHRAPTAPPPAVPAPSPAPDPAAPPYPAAPTRATVEAPAEQGAEVPPPTPPGPAVPAHSAAPAAQAPSDPPAPPYLAAQAPATPGLTAPPNPASPDRAAPPHPTVQIPAPPEPAAEAGAGRVPVPGPRPEVEEARALPWEVATVDAEQAGPSAQPPSAGLPAWPPVPARAPGVDAGRQDSAVPEHPAPPPGAGAALPVRPTAGAGEAAHPAPPATEQPEGPARGLVPGPRPSAEPPHPPAPPAPLPPLPPRDPRAGGVTGYALGDVKVPAWREEDRTAEASVPPADPQRPTVRHLGDRAPTYAAEPGALPATDPAALDDLPPDTVMEGARYGTYTLRAASLRGDSARFRGEARRDFLLTARFGSGDDALVMVVLAGGDRAAPGAPAAAAELCRIVAAAVGRSQERLADDIRAGRRDALRSGLQRLTDRGYGRLRAHAAEQGLAEEAYTAGLRALLLPVDPECRTRVCFGSGAGGLFRLRSGQWQDLEPDEPTTDGGDFRFRASVARPGDTLLVCSGGLAEPMREEALLPAELAARWAEPEPPGLAAFLADTQLRLKGYADDRTAAAVWEA